VSGHWFTVMSDSRCRLSDTIWAGFELQRNAWKCLGRVLENDLWEGIWESTETRPKPNLAFRLHQTKTKLPTLNIPNITSWLNNLHTSAHPNNIMSAVISKKLKFKGDKPKKKKRSHREAEDPDEELAAMAAADPRGASLPLCI